MLDITYSYARYHLLSSPISLSYSTSLIFITSIITFISDITYFHARYQLLSCPISLSLSPDITYHTRYHLCSQSLSLIFISDIAFFHIRYHLRNGKIASFRFLLTLLLLLLSVILVIKNPGRHAANFLKLRISTRPTRTLKGILQPEK
jgi:hypothetical protein